MTHNAKQDFVDLVLVNVASSLLLGENSIERVSVKADDKIVSKSITGHFPMLESGKEQVRLSGGLSIARSLAQEHPSFLGGSNGEKAQIN